MAQTQVLSDGEMRREQDAIADGLALVNPTAGILSVGGGKSNDRPGEAALVIYMDPKSSAKVPVTVDGVRTAVSFNQRTCGRRFGDEISRWSPLRRPYPRLC